MPVDQIQALMEALGPVSDDIAAIARNGEAAWAVAYDEDTIVAFDLVEDQGKLVLSIDLGQPAPVNRFAVYETMLSYNLLWPETGGVKMGLGGAGGGLVQMFELNTTGLDVERLQTVLEGFVAKALMWRRFVADGPQDGEAPFPMLRPEEQMIRV